ncbi:tRNA a64-2'-O-ribosylphosphate transferase [Histoplasma capsulatum H143]|uniref:tRNA a64-2'-O-ribosylphosphate transferase n=1 Tax=Ajellomyces capsulatus (strain H143) TaxID=544712 RepID=C6HPN1_AJECH|nr:tRNA a64-2'-O-ribosylphosphate transferase [Histoplasma capsulatum H143]
MAHARSTKVICENLGRRVAANLFSECEQVTSSIAKDKILNMANPSPYPTSISSLHFPSSAHQSISQVLSSLRKSALSITNRLRSIEEDSEFAEHVADHYGLPLVANERCGSWYIPTDRKAGSAYFKSTDGHEGQWDFSLRRLNLQLLDILRENGGCVIVDSTRRGKSMPDALSKTVPIWTAVLNRALFPNEKTFHDVQFPPDFLGASEESQIEKRIDGFVISLNHHREMGNEDAVLIRPTNNIYIGRSGRGSNSEPAVVGINEERLFDLRINCNAPDAGDTDTSLTEPTTEEDAKALSLGCPSGKLGSRQLRKVLNKVEQFVALHLSRDPSQSLIVTCDNGKDLSAGAILMIICLFYNEEGNFEGPRRGAFINKEYIRQRFAWVISSKHDVNPSRSTLQSVHAFLMKRP